MRMTWLTRRWSRMSDVIQAAIVLRDRLAVDATLAKDRAEYLRTVANWNDANRLVEALRGLTTGE